MGPMLSWIGFKAIAYSTILQPEATPDAQTIGRLSPGRGQSEMK
jgi:hypothetical protein